jgi:phosphate transport system substrate-binding protein
MNPRVRRKVLSAGLSTLICLAIAGVALGIARIAESGPTPPTASNSRTRENLPADLPLQVAGSGSNLPLTRLLLTAWAARERQSFTLHASIGTTGAIQALRGGAIHLGLLSRALKAEERAQEPPLQIVHYAQSVVVLAAHPDVSDRDLPMQTLLAMLGGARSTWSDLTPRTFLLRERGDSSQATVAAVVPEFARLEREAQASRRFRVIYSDAELRQVLLNTPGAMGWTDLGALAIEHSALVALALDGIAPSVQSAREGTYRLTKPLDFAVIAPIDPRVQTFLAFVASPEGRAITERSGFIPAGDAL